MMTKRAVWISVLVISLLSVASVESYNGVGKRKSGRFYCEVRILGTDEKLWVGSYDTEVLAALACDVAFYYTNRLTRLNLAHSEQTILRCCQPKSAYARLNSWNERRSFIQGPANALVQAIQSDVHWLEPGSIVEIQSELIRQRVFAHFSTRPRRLLQEFIAYIAWFLDPSNEQRILEAQLEHRGPQHDLHDQQQRDAVTQQQRDAVTQQQRDAAFALFSDAMIVVPQVDPSVNMDDVLTHLTSRIQARAQSNISSIMQLLLIFGIALPFIFDLLEKEKVWSKLQALRGQYLGELTAFHGELAPRIDTQPMPPDQLQKLKDCMGRLAPMIANLRVPQDRVLEKFNIDKLEVLEMEIVTIMDMFGRHERSIASTCEDDEKKQVWSKLQALRGQYLGELTALHGELAARIDTQRMPPDQLQELNHCRGLLARILSALQSARDRQRNSS